MNNNRRLFLSLTLVTLRSGVMPALFTQSSPSLAGGAPQRFTTSLWAGIHSDHLNVGEIYVRSRYMCLNPTLVPLCALPAALTGCFASIFYFFHPYFICNKARRLLSLLDLIVCLLQREKNCLRGEISCWVLATYIGYIIFPLGTYTD